MNDEDALLRRLGALAKKQEEEPLPAPALDDLARERIVAHLATNVPAQKKNEKKDEKKKRAPLPYVVGGLALAAAIAIAATRIGEPDPLPEYALLTSGDAVARGPSIPAGQPCRVRAADQGSFEIVASTERAKVSGPITARAYLVKDGELVPWAGRLETSAEGAVRIQDERAALTGATELRVVITRSAADADSRARGPSWTGRGFQVLRCVVD